MTPETHYRRTRRGSATLCGAHVPKELLRRQGHRAPSCPVCKTLYALGARYTLRRHRT